MNLCLSMGHSLRLELICFWMQASQKRCPQGRTFSFEFTPQLEQRTCFWNLLFSCFKKAISYSTPKERLFLALFMPILFLLWSFLCFSFRMYWRFSALMVSRSSLTLTISAFKFAMRVSLVLSSTSVLWYLVTRTFLAFSSSLFYLLKCSLTASN